MRAIQSVIDELKETEMQTGNQTTGIKLYIRSNEHALTHYRHIHHLHHHYQQQPFKWI